LPPWVFFLIAQEFFSDSFAACRFSTDSSIFKLYGLQQFSSIAPEVLTRLVVTHPPAVLIGIPRPVSNFFIPTHWYFEASSPPPSGRPLSGFSKRRGRRSEGFHAHSHFLIIPGIFVSRSSDDSFQGSWFFFLSQRRDIPWPCVQFYGGFLRLHGHSHPPCRPTPQRIPFCAFFFLAPPSRLCTPPKERNASSDVKDLSSRVPSLPCSRTPLLPLFSRPVLVVLGVSLIDALRLSPGRLTLRPPPQLRGMYCHSPLDSCRPSIFPPLRRVFRLRSPNSTAFLYPRTSCPVSLISLIYSVEGQRFFDFFGDSGPKCPSSIEVFSQSSLCAFLFMRNLPTQVSWYLAIPPQTSHGCYLSLAFFFLFEPCALNIPSSGRRSIIRLSWSFFGNRASAFEVVPSATPCSSIDLEDPRARLRRGAEDSDEVVVFASAQLHFCLISFSFLSRFFFFLRLLLLWLLRIFPRPR